MEEPFGPPRSISPKMGAELTSQSIKSSKVSFVVGLDSNVSLGTVSLPTGPHLVFNGGF